MNVNALKVYLVRNEDGTIDYQESKYKLEDDLNQFEVLHDNVIKAVTDVFTQYKGTKINKPGVVTFALGKLGATPSDYQAMEEAVILYLDENTGEKGSGKLFGSNKGRGGGSFVWADQK